MHNTVNSISKETTSNFTKTNSKIAKVFPVRNCASGPRAHLWNRLRAKLPEHAICTTIWSMVCVCNSAHTFLRCSFQHAKKNRPLDSKQFQKKYPWKIQLFMRKYNPMHEKRGKWKTLEKTKKLKHTKIEKSAIFAMIWKKICKK